MKMCRIFPSLIAILLMTLASTTAQTQSTDPSTNSARPNAATSSPTTNALPSAPPYVRPSEKQKRHNYLFDMVGPYPIVGAAAAAGINQADNTPPEWGQGAEAYGKRFASNFGIAAVTTTTRYGLAEIFKEDTIYYRCECKGFFPRLEHAAISTITTRRGEDGHRGFSFSDLISPYAGTMTAVYGWFPGRYGAKDGFRMGNYALLASVGGNIALEFIWRGPSTLTSIMHHKKQPAAQP
jgi:hypothetical protein